MTESIDLQNLHEMTGGDPELEKELFDVFVASSEDCIQILRDNATPETQEEWRTQAHAWKGMALNLGANKLGELCAKAQLGCALPEDDKKALLAELDEAFSEVKTYLSENAG